jgi:hypothetical protein
MSTPIGGDNSFAFDADEVLVQLIKADRALRL